MMLLQVPKKPSAREVEEHIAKGHATFAAWCEHCVRGSAQDDPHRRGTEDEGWPQVQVAFMFLSSSFDVVSHWTEAMIVVLVAIESRRHLTLLCSCRTRRSHSTWWTRSSRGSTTWALTRLC